MQGLRRRSRRRLVMSAIISGVDYTLLFPGGTSSTGAATNILTALYGGGTSSTATSTGNPLTDLKLAQANRDKAVAREAKTPEVQRDVAAFKAGIAKAKDVETA